MRPQPLALKLQTRPPVAPAAPRDLRKWVRALGWYLLLATGYLLVKMVDPATDLAILHQLNQLAHLLSGYPIAIVIAFAGVSLVTTTAVAGVLLVRGHKLGPYFGIASFSAQIVSLTVPGFSYQYVPGLAVQAYWSEESVGFMALLGPDTHITYGGSDPVRISVDILASAAVILLIQSLRRAS